MTTQETIDLLKALGYEVSKDHIIGDIDVYHIKGFDIEIFITSDNDELWQGVIDEHAEREQQQNESTEETMLRWHNDPDNEFELPADSDILQGHE
jgi:hypothetical protein